MYPRMLLPLSLLTATVLTGCVQSTAFLTDSKSAAAEEPAGPKPAKVVCLWEPSEGVGPDGHSARGFAGQILFFSPQNPTPVKIDGKVEIYEFHDQGTREEQAQPLQKFTFDSGAWNAHLIDSSLGPSYNVFIPYMARHPYKAVCALKLRFTPADGSTPLYSDMNSVTLPGPENEEDFHARKASITMSAAEIIEDGLDGLLKESGDSPATNSQIIERSAGDKELRSLTIRPNAGRRLQR